MNYDDFYYKEVVANAPQEDIRDLTFADLFKESL